MTAQRFYNDVVRHQGLPEKIISDRDTRFAGEFWQELMRRAGVRTSMTTAFNPRADGQAERSNAIIEIGLRHYVDQEQGDWDRFIPDLEFAINSSVHATTKTTPFEMIYGFLPRTALSFLHKTTTNMRVEEAMDFATRRRAIQQSASDCIAYAQAKMAIHESAGRTPRSFSAGDLVMLNVKDISSLPENFNRKLGPQRIGPLKVIEKISDLAYRIQLPSSWRIHDVFSIAKLEPVPDGLEATSTPPDLTTTKATPEDIVGEKTTMKGKGRVIFLVKWKDRPSVENTWEDGTELTKAGYLPLILRFRARLAETEKRLLAEERLREEEKAKRPRGAAIRRETNLKRQQRQIQDAEWLATDPDA